MDKKLNRSQIKQLGRQFLRQITGGVSGCLPVGTTGCISDTQCCTLLCTFDSNVGLTRCFRQPIDHTAQ